ncbi:Lysophospholipid transporter LplT [Pseudobythopirellula maris]|uniref:Lysophospholipid transporter LplT n=1 Tax=Pseudobythopirellula maris TaxID=2527991 RepID=A0A5C5ZKM6_9BACT|nr:MFS transporter [Pseudobythopirellula maris]TWT87597.1 Lysophospholipid transporter LplT [Pseudobythopirellula maris]
MTHPNQSTPLQEQPPLPSSTRVTEELPPLTSDPSFWAMSLTQFLGAFNDNVFKQLLLLLATPTAAAIAAAELAGESAPDRQSEAMIVFAAAFLIFSGFAGWLADRTSKRTLIVASKAAEILVMAIGMVGFYFYDLIGFGGMLVVLFLMGVQSAFFGPPKYGILPETLRDSDLPRANGIFLMFTFLAIIFGVVVAGLLKAYVDNVWLGSAVCVLIAVVGTMTALGVRRVPPATPGAPLGAEDLLVPRSLLRVVWSDRQLMLAVLVTSAFWMLGGVVQQSVNALGKSQLGLGDAKTSLLAAMLGVGIPVGCVLGGYLSRGRINPRVVVVGASVLLVCLLLMALRGGANDHLLGFGGSIPVLVVMGIGTGMFIVPVQVSIQALPPADEKGRMIALMNQCNWIGIVLGAILFKVALVTLDAAGQPRNTMFLVAAAIMLPVALFYRPEERSLSD